MLKDHKELKEKLALNKSRQRESDKSFVWKKEKKERKERNRAQGGEAIEIGISTTTKPV